MESQIQQIEEFYQIKRQCMIQARSIRGGTVCPDCGISRTSLVRISSFQMFYMLNWVVKL